MAKYLLTGNYVGEGVKGLLKDGGSTRRAAVEKLLKSVGGKLESMYYAFGPSDFYIIVDVPDHASAAAASLIASASGAVRVSTTVLMTPEEIDQAAKKKPDYSPPGR